MIDFCSAILLPLNGFIFIQKKEIRNWFFYFREYITTSIIFSNPSVTIDIDFSHTQPCIESTCTFQNIIHERLSISMSIMSGNICLHKWPLFFTNKYDNINETQRGIPTSNHRIFTGYLCNANFYCFIIWMYNIVISESSIHIEKMTYSIINISYNLSRMIGQLREWYGDTFCGCVVIVNTQ